MEVIPSIDLEGGRAVKRVKGEKGTGLILGDPIEIAYRLTEDGARWLHIVDLDGVELGHPANLRIASKMKRELGARIQYGGGIRSIEHTLEAAGSVDRIVVGSAWITDPGFLDRLSDVLRGDRVLAAVEERGGRIVYSGWTKEASISVEEAIRMLEVKRIGGYLYTQVDVEGTLAGPRMKDVEALRRMTSKLLIYAGGISSLEHLRALCRAGVDAAILGMAIYTGSMSLRGAMEAGRCRRNV